jgi:hypothetical protein
VPSDRHVETRHDETFWEAVHRLRREGRLPRHWTRAQLRPLLRGRFADNTINSVPSNQSMTPDGREQGDYVRRGIKAAAWRVAPGVFELVDDPDDDDLGNGVAGADATRPPHPLRVVLHLEGRLAERAAAMASALGTTIDAVAKDALQLHVLQRQFHGGSDGSVRWPKWGDPARVVDLSPAKVAELLDDQDRGCEGRTP